MTRIFRIVCAISVAVASNAVFSLVRDEIFYCNQVNESNNDEHHKILRDEDAYRIRPLALKSIPRINHTIRTDRDFFVRAISSTIKRVNELVSNQRKLVLAVQKKRRQSMELTQEEANQFDKICCFYQTKNIDELLMRVVPVPVSLAVAQAALESRFGSDQLIHRLNAYFGLAKSGVQLLKFDSLFNSAIAYMKTLNVNPRFLRFREQRALMLRKFNRLDGLKLVECLKNYGSDKNYCYLVRSLIISNNLSALD
jgi:Bax protein